MGEQSITLNQNQSIKKQKRKISTTPREGKHTFVVGKTGLGKSRFIREYIEKMVSLHPRLNIYIIDSKKRGDFSSADGHVILSEHAPPAYKTEGNRMVWQPLVDSKSEYSNFFMSILNAGLPAIVDIDECINMRFGDDIPRGLSILLAQGRLPGIHVIGGTQEVARAPRQLLSQATHIISFNVTNRYDEQMMLEILHLKEQNKKHLNLKKYEFYHIRPDEDDAPTKYKSYEEYMPQVV